MRIDPTKVPHLVKKDSTSPVPDGMRRGLVPKQTSLSVQDVRDYTTPQGAAMANEEMHRLRDAIEAVTEQVNTPAVSTDEVTAVAPAIAPTPAILIPNPDEDIDYGSQEYTVSHNLTPVGEKYLNRETNYFDGTINSGDRYDIIFETFPVGNRANVKGYVNIPKPQIPIQYIYTEEFYTDRYFSNEPHARLSELTPNYIKFGTIVYHDVKHNFGIDDINRLLWSITYTGEPTYRSIPVVIPIDKNTIRVYSSVRDGLSSEWQYLNTDLMSMPEEERIAKESIPKFYIAVYTLESSVVLILHGGYANTIDYNSIIHGGYANTIVYNSIINGGKP